MDKKYYLEIIKSMHSRGDVTKLESRIIYILSKDFEGIRDLLDMYNEESSEEQIYTSEFIQDSCLDILLTWYQSCREKHVKKRS
jgi:hypothetical protein